MLIKEDIEFKEIEIKKLWTLGSALSLFHNKPNLKIVVAISDNQSKFQATVLMSSLTQKSVVFFLGESLLQFVHYAIEKFDADVGVYLYKKNKKINAKIFNGNGLPITREQESFIDNFIKKNSDNSGLIYSPILTIKELKKSCNFYVKNISNFYIKKMSKQIENINTKNKQINIELNDKKTKKILEKIFIKNNILFKFSKQKRISKDEDNIYIKINNNLIKNIKISKKHIKNTFFCTFLAKKLKNNKIIFNLSNNFYQNNDDVYYTNFQFKKDVIQEMLQKKTSICFHKNCEIILLDFCSVYDIILLVVLLIKYASEIS